MNVHFIAIGGSAMHNLAIALHKKGYRVTGSDDEIFDPAKSRLEKYGILPKEIGWFPEKISRQTDAIILGMHAREDNPELQRANELGIPIYSYPEYLYEQSKSKTRIVIAGSHGKTSITAMILHVLNKLNIDTDYMVGAQLEGFEVMVKLSEEAKYMILEGDEYLTSPIDRRPKFHLYKPHIAIISGIAWDHINVFPTFDIYVEQFKIFVDTIMPDGHLIYSNDDEKVVEVASTARKDIITHSYSTPDYSIRNGITFVNTGKEEVALKVFGKHNLQNIEGARNICNLIGVSNHDFYEAIASFQGAAKRLELVKANGTVSIYKDFAHAPSKLKATIAAMKEQYVGRKLVACMELHTFSSLTSEFLQEYKHCMDEADVAIVYFNRHTLAHKKLPDLSVEDVQSAFGKKDLVVFTDSKEMCQFLKSQKWEHQNLLMMSSGNFDRIDFKEFANEII